MLELCWSYQLGAVSPTVRLVSSVAILNAAVHFGAPCPLSTPVASLMTATTSHHVPITQSDDWGDFVSASPPTSPNKLHPSNSPSSEDQPRVPPIPVVPSDDALSEHHLPQRAHALDTHTERPSTPNQPLQGFDTLDPVQRYALGALAVVLLNQHVTDLNGAAFARTQAASILQALQLTPGQQTALLALEPTTPTRHDVVSQCVQLVGDDDARFLALQAMLALSVVTGRYDARSRAFLASVASEFGVSWRAVAAVELAVAIQLFEDAELEEERQQRENGALSREEDADAGQENDSRPKTVDQLLIERRKKKMRIRKALKISGITLVGGMLFGLTGGLIAPALLSALAGVGVASAAGLAASGTLASGAVVGGLFGVAGAGFTVKKARHRVSTNLDEFDFERADDPRVIEARKRKEERQRRKMERLVAQRLAEEAAANDEVKKIEGTAHEDGGPPPVDAANFDAEKELPRPPGSSDEDEDDDEDARKKRKRFGTRRKKQVKQKVGPRGLEAASQIPSLHVCICVPAWLTERAYGAALDQFEPGLKVVLPCSQHIALRWESRRLYEMGLAFAKFWASKATVTTIQQAYPHAVAAASTVAGAVAFAFAMPLTIMSCMDYIDNPWSILVSRSNGAGDELADVLVERSYGHRPVSLFGYSIGARVIFKCLESLASRGARGIVDNVYVMGAAVTADPERWKKIRPVVAGRIVNAYGSYDWALAFFHRGCGHGVYVSGLRRVEIDGVENLNMGYLGIEGHRELKDCVPRVMRAMGLGVGYIVMPPARLVHRKRKSKGGQRKEEAPVCEDPADGENSSEFLNVSPSESGSAGHLAKMQNDTFWAGDDRNEETDQRPEGGSNVVLPPSIESGNFNERSQHSMPLPTEANENKDLSQQSKRKKKSKSWLSWSSWSGYGSKSKKSHLAQTEKVNVETEASDTDGQYCAQKEDVQRGFDAIPVVDGATLNGTRDEIRESNGVTQDSDGSETTGAELDVACEDFEEPEAFDWEKQRRIWEEQERQMQDRGYADSAEEIEMRNKVVLNIGVEVAGRRLARFISQDEELPVAKKEELYTNCVEDQRGVLVRVYEHEKRTKSVPINMLKADEQYPKLLGELEVKLRKASEKGKLRIAVAIDCDEEGNVNASVEEWFPDGSVGDRAERCIPRADLCTMSERRRLETAERKRLEAQIQKEMRNRNSQSVPALPAPPESGVGRVAENDSLSGRQDGSEVMGLETEDFPEKGR